MRLSTNQFLLGTLVLIWLVFLVNNLLSMQLNQLGIQPRQLHGLTGVLAAPFLHGGLYHLINNSLSFITLGWLVSLYNKSRKNLLLKLSIFVAIVGGLLTWSFGRPSIHIGLSGVIFGYWGFLTINGLFERSLKSILISIAAIALYSGMFFGVLPSTGKISFESHLFGALSGVIYSYLYRK